MDRRRAAREQKSPVVRITGNRDDLTEGVVGR